METKEKVIDYVMNTPNNTNKVVLESLLTDENTNKEVNIIRLANFNPIELTPNGKTCYCVGRVVDSKTITEILGNNKVINLFFNIYANMDYIMQVQLFGVSNDINDLNSNTIRTYTSDFINGINNEDQNYTCIGIKAGILNPPPGKITLYGGTLFAETI